MKIARVSTSDGILTGRFEDGTVVSDSKAYDIGSEATILSPVSDSTLYCVGRNYVETLDQMEYDRPSEPDFFIKPSASIHPPKAPIQYPKFSNKVTYAGELAAIIGEKCKNVAPSNVDSFLQGYTIMNDIDALDQHGRTARKAFNCSAPLGPWIETDIDPVGLDMRTIINGEKKQQSNTDLMLFKPHEIVSFLSKRITLRSGDVIAFGSPANPGLIEPDDEIEITYDGIGTLRNTVNDRSSDGS